MRHFGDVAVGGAHDAVARAGDFFYAVGAPADHSGCGEEGGEELLGDAEHIVDKARVHIHVGADDLVAVLHREENAGGEALDALYEFKLVKAALCLCDAAREAL